MWNLKKRRFGTIMDHRKEFRAPYSTISAASTQPSKSTRSRKQSVTGHHSTEVVIEIDTEPYVQQPAAPNSPSKAKRHTTVENAPIRITTLIALAFLICNFAIGLFITIDMWSAEGMLPCAVALSTMTGLGGLVGLHLEIVFARGKKSPDETELILLASLFVDMLPTIFVRWIMLQYGSNCAYLISMSERDLVNQWMPLITLVNSIRKCGTITARVAAPMWHESHCTIFSVLSWYLTFLYCFLFVLLPSGLWDEICLQTNADCSRQTAAFRITADTLYPIVADCHNNTEAQFVLFRLESTIEANFTTWHRLHGERMNMTTDCRRLAGFDLIPGSMEREENCTLFASTTDPKHRDGNWMATNDHGGEWIPEFSLDIRVVSPGGVARSVPFCPPPEDDAVVSRDYQPTPYEVQNIFRAYCRIGSNETVYECPSMNARTTKMEVDESPIAWFNCTRPCYARPLVDQQKMKPMIRFKHLRGRLIIGEREYVLKYKMSPMCW